MIRTLRIPLIGSIVNRNTDVLTNFSTRDQYFNNCYPEVTPNSITGKSNAFIYKRLGTAHTAGASNYKTMPGAFVWTGLTTGPAIFAPQVASSSHTLAIIDSSGTTQYSTNSINAVSVLLSETKLNNSPTLVFTATKSTDSLRHGWFASVGGAVTEITSNVFPPNQGTPIPIIGDFASMDGYTFIMATNGQVWNSDLNAISTWTANAYQTAQSMPDDGVGVARYKNLIVAFGRMSIEFFQNAGLTPSPLQAIGSAVRKIGAASGEEVGGPRFRTIIPVGDTIYFIGRESESGRLGVYRLNGFMPEKVSTIAIDKILEEAQSELGYGLAGSFTMHGMTHVLFDVKGTGVSQAPCYCVDTNTWWYMKPSSTQLYWNNALGLNGVAYFTTDKLVSGIFNSSPLTPVFQDNAQTMTQTIQIGPLNMGTSKKKYYKELRVDGDTQASTSNLAVSYSDDDGVTFSTPRNIDMNLTPKSLHRLGASYAGRTWRLTHAANTPNRMRAIEIDYEIGES